MPAIHKVALFAGCACVLALLAFCGRAVELSIIGHVAGQGLQMLNYTGDALNVTLSQNATNWSIIAGGHA